jgi:hypothetical protein
MPPAPSVPEATTHELLRLLLFHPQVFSANSVRPRWGLQRLGILDEG